MGKNIKWTSLLRKWEKILKIHCSKLKCPHCGASDFDLMELDVFSCNYCKEKFNFELQDIDFSKESLVFRQELKAQFEEKVSILHKKVYENKQKLIEYSSKANARKLVIFSGCWIVFSIMLFFSYIPIGIFSLLISLMVFIFAKKSAKKRYEKYQPLANKYANKIVNYQKEIDFYDAIISKLID